MAWQKANGFCEAVKSAIILAAVCGMIAGYSSWYMHEHPEPVKVAGCQADGPNETVRTKVIDGVPMCIIEERI